MRRKVLITLATTSLCIIFGFGLIVETFNLNQGNIYNNKTKYTSGEVQVQPSYNDNGWHCAQGYLKFVERSKSGEHLGEYLKYTPMGIDQEDSRILRVPYYTYNLSNSDAAYTEGTYGFIRMKHAPVPYLY